MVRIAKTISSLAINEFVFILDIGLELENRLILETFSHSFCWEKFLKKNLFMLALDLLKDRNRAGIRKLKNTTLLRSDGGLHSGFQHGALAAHTKVN